MRSSPARIAAALAAAVLTACTPGPAPQTTPLPEPAPATTQPPLVEVSIATADAPRVLDPAGATTQADAMVALSAFRRLMTVLPESGMLKPDLAADCLYTSATTYECDIAEGITFANGHALTASDIKFSIDRARKFAAARGVRQWESLASVEVVDALHVRFNLLWSDTQFGFALAEPAASIVDEELYEADALRAPLALPQGSGPYRIVTVSKDELVFDKVKDYVGAYGQGAERVRLRLVADSAAAEQLMRTGSVHAVWRALSPAALERLAASANVPPTDPDAPTYAEADLSKVPRLVRLVWNPASPSRIRAEVRGALAVALQADRSAASLLPAGQAGGVASFTMGGRPTLTKLPQPVALTLSYDPKGPSLARDAREVRDAASAVGITVTLKPGDAAADLALTDEPASVNTALGWLEPYLRSPLPGSAAKLSDLERRARQSRDVDDRAAVLAELQHQAAADLTVLPVRQEAPTLVVRKGITLAEEPFGPGYQLGIWSIRS